MNFIYLLNTVITLAILLGVGFFSRKIGLIDDAFSKYLSTMIVKLGQPMLIISSLLSLEFTPENFRSGLICLGISFVLHLVMGVPAFIFSRAFRDADERKIAEFSMVFTNCGFIGFPILESLYGERGLFCGAFYLIGFHLFIWTYGILILSRGRDDIKLTPKKILINYGTVPCAIGVVLFLLPVRFPQFVGQTMEYLASLCTPISLLITGALIATGNMRELFGRARNYLVCAVRLLIIPTIVCVLARLVGLPDFYVMFATVMAAMPSASIVSMLGEMYGISPAFASRLVGITSVMCALTLPVIVKFSEFIVSI